MNLSEAQELLRQRTRLQGQREPVMILLGVSEAQEIGKLLEELREYDEGIFAMGIGLPRM